MSQETAGSTPETLPPLVREAIHSILAYLWEDELEDLCEQFPDADDDPTDSGHVFERLVALDNWVNGDTRTVKGLWAGRRRGG